MMSTKTLDTSNGQEVIKESNLSNLEFLPEAKSFNDEHEAFAARYVSCV